MPQELPQRIGFIGAGQMAEALARGFVAQGISSPAKMRCTDPNDVRRGVFEEFGATAYGSSLEVSLPPSLDAPLHVSDPRGLALCTSLLTPARAPARSSKTRISCSSQ